MPTVAADRRKKATVTAAGKRFNLRWSLIPELLLSSVLIFIALELIFFAAGLGDQEFLQPDPCTGTAPMPGKHVTWRQEGFSRTTFNSFGMRDKERLITKQPNAFRIAVLGDSYVEALQVERSQSFCQLVENLLNTDLPNTHVEVLNFGVSAYNLGQMYLRLKHLALDFKPDLVILSMRIDQSPQLDPNPHGGMLFARPTFAAGPDGLLKQDNSIQEDWLNSPDGKRMQLISWLRRYSRVWGVISLSAQHLSRSNKDDRWGYQERPVERQWPVAHALIQACKDICNRQDCRFMILALPGPGLQHNQQQLDLLSNSAGTLAVPFLNLTPSFNEAKKNGKNLYYSCHMNEDGHKLLAGELSKFIAQTHLLAPAP